MERWAERGAEAGAGGLKKEGGAHLEHLARLDDGAQPEVREAHVAPRVEQQVLRLEVAVDDAALVAVVHRLDRLHKVARRLRLAQPPAALDVRAEVAVRGALHDEVVVGLRVDDLVQPDDVLVLRLLEDANLAVDRLGKRGHGRMGQGLATRARGARVGRGHAGRLRRRVPWPRPRS